MKIDVELVQVGNPEELRNMPIVQVRNDKKEIVTTLYILDDGNIHADSWIKCK